MSKSEMAALQSEILSNITDTGARAHVESLIRIGGTESFLRMVGAL